MHPGLGSEEWQAIEKGWRVRETRLRVPDIAGGRAPPGRTAASVTRRSALTRVVRRHSARVRRGDDQAGATHRSTRHQRAETAKPDNLSAVSCAQSPRNLGDQTIMDRHLRVSVQLQRGNDQEFFDPPISEALDQC